jgi:hypothetical protein
MATQEYRVPINHKKILRSGASFRDIQRIHELQHKKLQKRLILKSLASKVQRNAAQGDISHIYYAANKDTQNDSNIHQVPPALREKADGSLIKMSDEDADNLLVQELLELPQDSFFKNDLYQNSKFSVNSKLNQSNEFTPTVARYSHTFVRSQLSQSQVLNKDRSAMSRSNKVASSLGNSSKVKDDVQIFDDSEGESNIKIIENKVVEADKYILTLKDSVSSKIGRRVGQEDHKSRKLRKQSVQNVQRSFKRERSEKDVSEITRISKETDQDLSKKQQLKEKMDKIIDKNRTTAAAQLPKRSA